MRIYPPPPVLDIVDLPKYSILMCISAILLATTLLGYAVNHYTNKWYEAQQTSANAPLQAAATWRI